MPIQICVEIISVFFTDHILFLHTFILFYHTYMYSLFHTNIKIWETYASITCYAFIFDHELTYAQLPKLGQIPSILKNPFHFEDRL